LIQVLVDRWARDEKTDTWVGFVVDFVVVSRYFIGSF
jgi:hypothetical protein